MSSPRTTNTVYLRVLISPADMKHLKLRADIDGITVSDMVRELIAADRQKAARLAQAAVANEAVAI